MIACLKKSDGRLIEAQSHGVNQTLIDNAINAGYNENDIEIVQINKTELRTLLEVEEQSSLNYALKIEKQNELKNNILLKFTYEEIESHINTKVPASGATLEVNKILKHLARAVKSLS